TQTSRAEARLPAATEEGTSASACGEAGDSPAASGQACFSAATAAGSGADRHAATGEARRKTVARLDVP
ncbi:MAG: hypothetical protein AB1716_25095, partial [Planctomycetota bacterium]